MRTDSLLFILILLDRCCFFQQGMNHMQRMLEACMSTCNWSFSVQFAQEVSAALNPSSGGHPIFDTSVVLIFFNRREITLLQSSIVTGLLSVIAASTETSEDGSKWCHVRKGTCCVFCDNHIDSLLYR